MDKLGIIFFNFIVPFITSFGTLYCMSTLHGEKRGYSIIILTPLIVVSLYYLYKNTVELFKSK